MNYNIGDHKILSLCILALILAGLSTGQQTDVQKPESDFIYDLQDGMTIEWSSEYSGQEINETQITIDSAGGQYQDTLSDPTGQIEIPASDLGNLSNSGEWSLQIVDDWADGSQSMDQIDFRAEETQMRISIDQPSTDFTYDRSSDLELKWTSRNGFTTEHELVESEITITDGGSNEYQDVVSRGTILYESQDDTLNDDTNSVTYNHQLTSSQFDSFNDGEWTIEVEDRWGMATVNYQDSLQIKADSSSSGYSDETIVNIQSPREGYTVQPGEDLDVEWSSTNDYASSQELRYTELRIVDGDNNIEEEEFNINEVVNPGETYSQTNALSSSDLEGLESGDWTLFVETVWGEDTSFESLGIQSEEVSGKISLGIDSPDPANDISKESDIIIDWSAINEYNDDRNLLNAELKLEDSGGRTVSRNIEINKTLAENDVFNDSQTIEKSEFSSFTGDNWTIFLETEWENDFYQSQQEYQIKETSDNDDSNDKSTDNSDSDNNNDDSTDDSTNDGADDNTNESSNDSGDSDGSDSDNNNDDSTDDSGDSDDSGDGEASNDCPDGFTYDSENDVCLEDSNSDSDSDDSDGSDGDTSDNDSSDDESSTDDQNSDDELTGGDDANTSMLQQEVAAGISVQTVLLGVLAVLTLGLFFRRSSYTLKF